MWKSDKTLLHNFLVKEIKKKIGNHFELSANKNNTHNELYEIKPN